MVFVFWEILFFGGVGCELFLYEGVGIEGEKGGGGRGRDWMCL